MRTILSWISFAALIVFLLITNLSSTADWALVIFFLAVVLYGLLGED